jgi:hypothetical protein
VTEDLQVRQLHLVQSFLQIQEAPQRVKSLLQSITLQATRFGRKKPEELKTIEDTGLHVMQAEMFS